MSLKRLANLYKRPKNVVKGSTPGGSKLVATKGSILLATLHVRLAALAENVLGEVVGRNEPVVTEKGHIVLKQAKKILITFSANPEPSLEEVRTAMKELMKSIDTDAVVYYNWAENLNIKNDELRLFVIASA